MKNKEEKIAILISTYNGERYLADQVRSIQEQSNHNWHLYIRDDGSKDRTPDILQKLAQDDRRISIIDDRPENLGVIKSFLYLLQMVDADYYMFSDQDDHWHSDKVDRAYRLISDAGNKQLPLCVHTELAVVDAQLRPLNLMKNGQVWDDFPHFMFGNCITGCTMIINQALKDKINFSSLNTDQIMMHDWWFALIAAAFGKVIYDPQPSIDYRQHESNIVGEDNQQSFRALVRRSLHLEREADGLARMLKQIREFHRHYAGQLSGKNAAYLNAYAGISADDNFNKVRKIIKHYPPQRSHKRGEVMLSYLLLFDRKKLFE